MENNNLNTQEKQLELAKKYAENQSENLQIRSNDKNDWRSLLNGRGKSGMMYNYSSNKPKENSSNLTVSKSKLNQHYIDFANKTLNTTSDSIFGGSLSKPIISKPAKSIFSLGTFSNSGNSLLNRYTQMYKAKKKNAVKKSDVLDNVALKYSSISNREMEKIVSSREKMADQPFFLIIIIAMVGLFLFFSMM